MTYTKTIVCLANSRKAPSGRCIAGREWAASGFGAWIRPVSGRATQEISEEERRYEDGRDPRVLDVVSITLAGARPALHQRENHLIDDKQYWVWRRSVGWKELLAAAEDPGGPLWENGHTSKHGHNDRVPEELASGMDRSLYLVRPRKLRLEVRLEKGGEEVERRRVRARFELCGRRYLLAVTDPLVEKHLMARPDGEVEIDEALLCVSLGELFHGFAYKLVASVITPSRKGNGSDG